MTAERLRTENQERENNLDQAAIVAVGEGVASAEIREATENGPSSEAVERAKRYFKEGGKYALSVASFASQATIGLVFSLLKFTKAVIEKRGKVGFSEGYKIGSETLSFGDKKDKKS